MPHMTARTCAPSDDRQARWKNASDFNAILFPGPVCRKAPRVNSYCLSWCSMNATPVRRSLAILRDCAIPSSLSPARMIVSSAEPGRCGTPTLTVQSGGHRLTECRKFTSDLGARSAAPALEKRMFPPLQAFASEEEWRNESAYTFNEVPTRVGLATAERDAERSLLIPVTWCGRALRLKRLTDLRIVQACGRPLG